jgi:hypothetical protein
MNVGANVNLTLTRINVGSATVNTFITSTAIETDGTLTVAGQSTLSGAVAIGTTSPYRNTGLNIAGLPVGISTRADSSSGGTHIEFVTLGGSIVGNITTNSSNTTYSTSSDYRLKYDYKDLQALDLINNLKIYQYKWKVDNAIGYGVMAHELQEYVPYAVTGQKDGEEMQAVDYSKIVPVLIKAIQEQQKQIEELKQLVK